MSNYTSDTDTLVHITALVIDRSIGFSSPYINKEHPGTNKKIEGWKWDICPWPTAKEAKATTYIASLWDPVVSGLASEDYWQSGYGDGDDLLLKDIVEYSLDEDKIWTPQLKHGHYYIFDQEWYLFGDDYQTEVFRAQDTISGMQYVNLVYRPKAGIPLYVRRFSFDKVLGRHIVDLDLRKVLEFSASGYQEFRIDTDYNPYRIWLDSIYLKTTGTPVLNPGTPDGALLISGLEIVGYGNGEANQEFRTRYSPIDTWENTEVWGWYDTLYPRQWNVISGYEDFTFSGLDVKLDSDLGLLQFGDYNPTGGTGSGICPDPGEHIGIHYTATPAVFYEPSFGRNYLMAPTADTNPLHSPTHKGFVLVTTEVSDPSSIVLSADLILSGDSYLISLGNIAGELTATVSNNTGSPVEGMFVLFELIEPTVGGFGTNQTTINIITDNDGEAKTTYSSPRLIDDVASFTDTIQVNGGDTYLTVSGVTISDEVSGLTLYKVHNDDVVLGIPEDILDEYYQVWVGNEGILEGGTALGSWEQLHRIGSKLGTPTTYTAKDLEIGRKTVILTTDREDVIDPLTGARKVAPYPFVPLYPSSLLGSTVSGLATTTLTYLGSALPIPPAENTKSYMLVGDTQVSIRASVLNPRSGQRIYSNTINLKVQIPDTMDGTFYADALNDIESGLVKPRDINDLSTVQVNATSGLNDNWATYFLERIWWGEVLGYETYEDWYKRTRRGDVAGLTAVGYGLIYNPLVGPLPADVPLGFRLKDANMTMASLLEAVTYFSSNEDLTSGYYD